MAEFRDQFMSRVPDGFAVPDEIVLLVEWLEQHERVQAGRRDPGELYGDLRASDSTGTSLAIHAEPHGAAERTARAWAGEEHAATFVRQVWPFANSADGSMVALWRDDHSRTHVVHLGSGSGSMLTCLLGEHPVDFLRLAAVGYDELCWPDQWAEPPAGPVDAELQDWVRATFGVAVPATGREVVPHPAEMTDDDPADPFLRWLFAIGVLTD